MKSTPVAGEHTKSEKLAGGKVQTVASPLPLMASEGGARNRPHATSHPQKKHGKLCSAIGGYTTFHVQETHAHTHARTHTHCDFRDRSVVGGTLPEATKMLCTLVPGTTLDRETSREVPFAVTVPRAQAGVLTGGDSCCPVKNTMPDEGKSTWPRITPGSRGGGATTLQSLQLKVVQTWW